MNPCGDMDDGRVAREITMTYDSGNQQHQGGYTMANLNTSDSNNYQNGEEYGVDMYSSDFHNYSTAPQYYGNSNSELMPSYDGNDAPSSSGLNIGQYFTAVDPMMMMHQPQPYGNGGSDYTDVNNLEPSLLPDQVNPVQTQANQQGAQYQHHHQMQLTSMTMTNLAPNQQRHVIQNGMAAYVTANYYGNSYHSSPTGSSHTSSGTDISDEGDDVFGLSPYKRTLSGELDYRGVKGKRQGKKRKPRKDPNEPQKPVSAYALFFRDTQAAIKGQNPNASFGEISKIVASMWDNLGIDAKSMYKQKTESAKKEYLKQLAAYRANLLSKGHRGNIPMDPFLELAAQQRKASTHTQSVSSPDSTTCTGLEQKDPCTEIGTKTLASLIAEPAPQQVLTATTTLTVPQSYTSARTKGDYSVDNDCPNGSPLSIRTAAFHQKQPADEDTHWSPTYPAEECVAKNCRDMYTAWVPGRPQQQQVAGTFAPV